MAREMHRLGRDSRFLPLLLGLSLLGGAALWTFAQDADAPPAGVEPKADQILRSMSKTLAAARQFTLEANDTSDQLLEDGQKVQVAKTVKVSVRRPNALSADVVGDEQDLRYVYLGEELTILNRREKCYARQKVPETIDAMFDFLAENYAITPPLADLMFADPYQAMTGRLRSGRYLGIHSVMGTPCHHLAFRQEGIDWQIWIEDSQQPLPRKVVITYKELPGYPQFIAHLDKWNLNPQLDDSTFNLEVPPDFKRLDLVPVTREQRAPAPPQR